MIEIEKKAENLFDKIRSRFENVSLGDEKANATSDPEDARFFNFDYISKDGTNFGNVHVSIVDPDVLKVFFAQNITDNLTPEQQEEWEFFLRGLRKFSRRHLMSFDARDITRSNLKLQDVKQQSKSDSAYQTHELEVTESVINESMYGSRINSYEDRGPVKIRIKHSDFIDPEKRGARSRKIENIYLETHRGERFLLDYNNLHYARAAARHVAEGGVLHDELGQHITGLMAEMQAMKHFVRGAQLREFDDPETTDMVRSAVNHYSKQKELLKKLRKSQDYQEYAKNYVPENAVEDDFDIDGLRERFVKKLYDDRFDEALPYVYRAYTREMAAFETEMAEEFAAWADQVHEGTWDQPDSAAEHRDLDTIMSAPLEVGQDASNAIATLTNIIGDDSLNQDLVAFYKETEDPDADARPIVMSWLQTHQPDLAAKYQTNMQPPTAPEQPKVPNQTVGATKMDEPVVSEDINSIKRLAGLVKK